MLVLQFYSGMFVGIVMVNQAFISFTFLCFHTCEQIVTVSLIVPSFVMILSGEELKTVNPCPAEPGYTLPLQTV